MRIIQVIQPNGEEFRYEKGEPRRLVNLVMEDGTQVKAVLEFEKLGFVVAKEPSNG